MKFNRTELRKLKAANLPKMRASDIADIKDPGPEADAKMKLLDDYLHGFVKSPDANKCICCGEKQGGDMIAGLLGTAKFRWGLAHGEGFCSACGYPGRALHYIGKGEDEMRLNFILQYHPDELSFDPSPAKEAVDATPTECDSSAC
jgi:hypothetical protein